MQIDPSFDGPLVYFIQSVNGGPVKIGYVNRASKLNERLANLQCASPYPLEVLKTLAGGTSVERQMHERFARWRLSGEWFVPCKDIEKFCGRSLGRRDETASMQRLIDGAYKRGYEAGYLEGEWEGQKILAKRVHEVVGKPEDWEADDPTGPHGVAELPVKVA